MQRFERKWFGSDSTTKDSEEEVVLDTMRETKANALPPQLREQYEKAKQAFDRKNLDYAVTLLENVLKLEPSCYDARQVLRATQVKRHDGKQGFFKKMQDFLDLFSRFETLTTTFIMPEMDQNASFFYEEESPQLRSKYGWYVNQLFMLGTNLRELSEESAITHEFLKAELEKMNKQNE